jgi:hypothetical protein
VADGVEKRRPAALATNVLPFVAKFHSYEGQMVLEIRPRSGRWYPGVVGVPKGGPLKVSAIMPGPSGHPTLNGMVHTSSGGTADGQWEVTAANHAIDALNALYVTFKGDLSGQIMIGGSTEGELYLVDLASIPH